MKQKILISFLFIMLLVNSGLIFTLWKKSQSHDQDIGYIENKVDRLDIEALEKIKSKEDSNNNICDGTNYYLNC
jgi:hypothetical protein